MPNWFERMSRSEETDPDKKKQQEQEELEIKATKEKLAKIDGIETAVNEFKSKTGVLDQMSEFLKEQQELKRKREAEARAKAANDNKESQDKELEELLLNDPIKAQELIAERKMQPLVQATINTQSQLLRKQIFDDNPSEFEYYHGEFKNKVDKLIDNLSLEHKTNPNAIKNCYAVAFYEYQKDIKEGKLKSRFASVSLPSSSTTSNKDKDEIVLSDEEKRAARMLGIKEEDYAKTKKEMNYV